MTDLLRPRDAALFLAIDVRTLRRYSDEGKIPVVVLPTRHRRYRREDLEQFISAKPA